jgi:predicted porin
MNKKLLTIAIAGAMTAPMTAHAIKWKMSGQVNRAVIFADDGENSDIKSVDNTASNTRFRMRGSEDMGNGMKVGAYWELGINSNRVDRFQPDDDFSAEAGDYNDPESVTIRQANLWFSGNWGKLTLGHTSEAADGTAGANLSGAGLATTGPGNTDTSGRMIFWDKNTGMGGPDTRASYSKYDGGRNDTIRYDSPKLGPVGLAASISSDSRWSAAAKAKTALGGGQLSAGLGYVHTSGYDQWSMSASYLFSQGTSIGGYYGTRDSSNDPQSWAITLGHKWGPHAVAATYAEGDDQGGADTDGEGYGVEYVHTLKKVNTQLYIGYRHAEYDAPGASYEDHDHVAIGARVKFD